MDIETVFQSPTSTITEQVADEADRAALLDAFTNLQSTRGLQDYVGAYQRILELAADYVTILGPFLPA